MRRGWSDALPDHVGSPAEAGLNCAPLEPYGAGRPFPEHGFLHSICGRSVQVGDVVSVARKATLPPRVYVHQVGSEIADADLPVRWDCWLHWQRFKRSHSERGLLQNASPDHTNSSWKSGQTQWEFAVLTLWRCSAASSGVSDGIALADVGRYDDVLTEMIDQGVMSRPTSWGRCETSHWATRTPWTSSRGPFGPRCRCPRFPRWGHLGASVGLAALLIGIS
jgi:hypothetical protein